MSYEHESQLDPAKNDGTPAGTPVWVLVGYLLGLLAMSPTPLLYYWLFAPAGALVVAAAALLASGANPRLRAVARGALLAAVFGACASLSFFLGLANT